MDVIFDWNLGNMIYNGLITLRLCGFPFTEIRSLHRVCDVAAIVYRREQGRGVSAGTLIVKTAGSIREMLAGRHVGDPLALGKARGYPRSYPTGSLVLVRDSLREAPTRTRGKLARFSIPR